MLKNIFFISSFFISCTKQVRLPDDFELNVYIFINLMPTPIQFHRKIKGNIEIKGTFEKEPEIKNIKILFDDSEFNVNFKKEKNYYIFEIPVYDIKEIKSKEYLKFKIDLFYKGKIFEVLKDKVEIKRIY
ncbi:MAG: hypothetical protein ABIM58_01790 [candidate division WOR-3 bacterium]